jgi:DDE superfamily endonuclease
LVKRYPEEDRIVLLLDHLNTHLSESLVRWVAANEGVECDLGKKGKFGILKNTDTRREFLEREEHRVRLLFTPKHCSWLNPVENWFAKLQAHILTNGNFSSVEKLNEKIEAYIKYYNACLVKPFNWKFVGFDKGKKLSLKGK